MSLVSVTAGGLALLLVVAQYANAAPYASRVGVLPFPPSMVVVLAAMGSLLLLLRRDVQKSLLSSGVTFWCLGFLTLASMSLIWSSGSAVAFGELLRRGLSVLALLTLSVVFSVPAARALGGRALVVCLVFAICLNVIELFSPGQWSTVLGRSAGWYVNPNISAAAITAGMIAALPFVDRVLRPGIVLYSGVGVILTASRGGLVAWCACACWLVARRQVTLRQLVLGAAALGLMGAGVLWLTGAWTIVVDLAQLAGLTGQSPWTRLFDTGLGDVSGVGADSRLRLASAAWRMFRESPILGSGIGATTEWELSQGPHNLYLRYAAEYGLVGLLVMPAFFLAFIRNTTGRRRVAAEAMVIFLSIWSLFDHATLDQWPLLVSIAVIAGVESDGTMATSAAESCAAAETAVKESAT